MTTVPTTGTGAQVADLDELIDRLAAGSERWTAMPFGARAALLRAVHATCAAQAAKWTRAACAVKGLGAGSPLVGEEWTSGPYAVLVALDAMATTLERMQTGAGPLDHVAFGTAPGGRVTVPVLPATRLDRLVLNGFRAEVWLRPGVDAVAARAAAGSGARGPAGGVGLVLGAGNVTAIPALDVLTELVAHNRAVVLKPNPIMAAMGPVFAAAFAPLIDAGVLRVVDGDGAVGSALAQHPGIAHVHITGSAATHDAIVWGRSGRRSGRPALTKPITSELGGVSPVIVVPGLWSARDLRFQAEHVATMRLQNNGHNCIAAQVVLLSSAWPQRQAFLAELRDAIARSPRRPTWYPGAADRIRATEERYPAALRLGPDHDRLLLDADADGPAPEKGRGTIEAIECFAPALGVRDLPGSGAAFLEAAVAFANDHLAGTLGANVLIDPVDRRAMGPAFDAAIAELRAGTIAINTWTGVGFATPTATWGAFPGNTIDDVGSGIGVVHNAWLIDSPERTVIEGPFRPFPYSVLHGERSVLPKPPWFTSARTAATTGRLLAMNAAKPTLGRLVATFVSAFRA